MDANYVAGEDNFDAVAAKENKDYEKQNFTGKEHFTEDLLNDEANFGLKI